MSPKDKAALLAEIVEMTQVRVVQPSDIRVTDYMTATGMSNATSRARLNSLVKQGTLKTATAFDPESCRRVRVWFKA